MNGRFRLLLAIGIAIVAAQVWGSASVSALSGADFRAGRIIDDGVFFNGSTMTVDQIQTFLNVKVPVCDTNGTQAYAGTTAGAYGASRGYPPPYTCLKEYRQDTVAREYEAGLCNGYSAARQSAAEIIYGVAQSCGINPKVLIVILQKEQGLITDDWPWSIQYRSATGYGCPDTAACDSEYYGFFNQVYSAARQFKNYAKNAPSFNYRANRNNYIQYNPDASCGGSTVYIENQATAGLYNYTPYQPNPEALAKLSDTNAGGTATCGAYGNRNFWWYFNRWFGPGAGQPYAWIITSQTYTPAGGSEQAYGNGVPIDPGETVRLKITVLNTGTETWSKDGAYPVRLATWGPPYRTSSFRTSDWISSVRVTGLQETSVAPGASGTFIFTAHAPRPGNYSEYFNLVAEGSAWFPENGIMRFNFNVRDFKWQVVSQSYGSSSTPYDNGIPAEYGQTIPVTIRVRNVGEATWRNNGDYPVRLATWGPPYRTSKVYSADWYNQFRPATLTESTVAPGQIGTFTFNTKPAALGNYGEYFNLVAEGSAWFPENGIMRFNYNVRNNYKWQVVSQSYGTSPSVPYDNGVPMAPNTTKTVTLVVKNIGDTTWYNSGDNPVRLATWGPPYRTSSFQSGSWISPVRVAVPQEATVAPGQNATFVFSVTSPAKSGNYGEYFNLVAEGVTWFPENGIMRFNFNVWP